MIIKFLKGAVGVRSKKALFNSMSSLLLEIVNVLSGFIVPRLIIGTYGSEINALTSSITQFLSYIAFAEAGVEGVILAALYKPLADGNSRSLSGVYNASDKFFKKVAYIFLGYTALLAAFYPIFVNDNFDWAFTSSLIAVISLSTFFQYYFGVTNSTLIKADQRQYIISFLQITSIVLNMVMVVVFVKLDTSIHILKFATSLIYIIRPLAMYFYVKKHYSVDRRIKPDNDTVSQRWDGLGHHIATCVTLNTDVTILTVFSKVANVVAFTDISVYTIYNSVVYGFVKFIRSLASGVETAFGNMIAKEEYDNLNKKFHLFESVMFMLVGILFTALGLLLIPFMKVYMRDVTDADYIRPLFGFLMVLAYGIYSIRIPYQIVVYAAGQYKQTKKGAYTEAIINVVASLALIPFMGIEGCILGTLLAMLFRTVQYVLYINKHLINKSAISFFKHIILTAISVVISMAAVHFIPSTPMESYFNWIVYAVEVTLTVSASVLAVNLLFCRKDVFYIVKYVRKLIFAKIK